MSFQIHGAFVGAILYPRDTTVWKIDKQSRAGRRIEIYDIENKMQFPVNVTNANPIPYICSRWKG